MSIILCNKLLCLTETYILYELDKHIRMTTVKKWFTGNGLSFNLKKKIKIMTFIQMIKIMNFSNFLQGSTDTTLNLLG